MADILLSGLQPANAISGSDLALVRQGTEDKKATLTQILQFIASQPDFNANTLLTKLLTVDGTTSGLDADLLDGQHGTFYRNAANLDQGTIPVARLPVVSATMAVNGGMSLGPMFNGLELRWGQGIAMMEDSNQRINFSSPFPNSIYHVFVTGEGRNEAFNGGSATFPRQNVELDVRPWRQDVNGFDCSSIRISGNLSDQVIPHYFAIGR